MYACIPLCMGEIISLISIFISTRYYSIVSTGKHFRLAEDPGKFLDKVKYKLYGGNPEKWKLWGVLELSYWKQKIILELSCKISRRTCHKKKTQTTERYHHVGQMTFYASQYVSNLLSDISYHMYWLGLCSTESVAL